MEHITQDGRKLEFYPAGASEWLVIDLAAAHAGYAWAAGDRYAVETRRAVVEYADSFTGALERI